MLTILGFTMIATFLILIMLKKMSPIAALVLIPALFCVFVGKGAHLGDYVIDALLTIRNTSIGMRRSVTLRVPDFLASGMAFGTPSVLSVPMPFTQTFARWSDVANIMQKAENPPDAAIAGLDRQPAVRFALFVEGGAGSVPCDVFYEVVDANDRQVAYGKRRVNLTGKNDEFLVTFNVDEWR